MKMHCSIIRDLLPLYYDGVASSETAIAVNEHLEECAPCRLEYESLKTEMGDCSTPDGLTRLKFAAMMKRQKRRRTLITILAAILSCALLVGAFCIMTQIPLRNAPDSDINVVRAYRYNVGDENKFFILYTSPHYNTVSTTTFDIMDDNAEKLTLVINKRLPVISKKVFEPKVTESIWIYDAESQDSNIDVLMVGDTVVWTEEANTAAHVPDYVYACDEFESMAGTITAFSADIEEETISAQYRDGTIVTWDLDGNVIK